MTRGKYAAKAKNRLANLDNEILQEAIAERDSLRMELDVERLKVQEAERLLHSRSMRKAGEIAADEVSRLRAEILQIRTSHRAEIERLGFAVARLIFPDGRVQLDPRVDSNSLLANLADLFGLGDKCGELIAHWGGDFAKRNYRRRDSKVFRVIAELHRQGLDGDAKNMSQKKRIKETMAPLLAAANTPLRPVTDNEIEARHVEEAS